MEAIMTSNLPIFFKYLKRISFSIFFGIELKVPKFPRFTKMHFFTGEREKTSRWSIEYGERERERGHLLGATKVCRTQNSYVK